MWLAGRLDPARRLPISTRITGLRYAKVCDIVVGDDIFTMGQFENERLVERWNSSGSRTCRNSSPRESGRPACSKPVASLTGAGAYPRARRMRRGLLSMTRTTKSSSLFTMSRLWKRQWRTEAALLPHCPYIAPLECRATAVISSRSRATVARDSARSKGGTPSKLIGVPH
jgi:hypothetical protein